MWPGRLSTCSTEHTYKAQVHQSHLCKRLVQRLHLDYTVVARRARHEVDAEPKLVGAEADVLGKREHAAELRGCDLRNLHLRPDLLIVGTHSRDLRSMLRPQLDAQRIVRSLCRRQRVGKLAARLIHERIVVLGQEGPHLGVVALRLLLSGLMLHCQALAELHVIRLLVQSRACKRL